MIYINNIYDKYINELINDIDILIDDVVEEELSPDECFQRLQEIIGEYSNKKMKKPGLKCVDDLTSLCEVIRVEQSTPDVIQEYLFFIIEHYAKVS